MVFSDLLSNLRLEKIDGANVRFMLGAKIVYDCAPLDSVSLSRALVLAFFTIIFDSV